MDNPYSKMDVCYTTYKGHFYIFSTPHQIIKSYRITIMPKQSQHEFKTYVQKIVHTNLSHPEFNLNTIIPTMRMKRSLFYQQFSLVFACTPNQFLRRERLKMAAHLLHDDSLSISDIVFQVGFTNHAYFTKCFREYYVGLTLLGY